MTSGTILIETYRNFHSSNTINALDVDVNRTAKLTTMLKLNPTKWTPDVAIANPTNRSITFEMRHNYTELSYSSQQMGSFWPTYFHHICVGMFACMIWSLRQIVDVNAFVLHKSANTTKLDVSASLAFKMSRESMVNVYIFI